MAPLEIYRWKPPPATIEINETTPPRPPKSVIKDVHGINTCDVLLCLMWSLHLPVINDNLAHPSIHPLSEPLFVAVLEPNPSCTIEINRVATNNPQSMKIPKQAWSYNTHFTNCNKCDGYSRWLFMITANLDSTERWYASWSRISIEYCGFCPGGVTVSVDQLYTLGRVFKGALKFTC